MKRNFLDGGTLPPTECGHESSSGRDLCLDNKYCRLRIGLRRFEEGVASAG
jgi:hypothetical protein